MGRLRSQTAAAPRTRSGATYRPENPEEEALPRRRKRALPGEDERSSVEDPEVAGAAAKRARYLDTRCAALQEQLDAARARHAFLQERRQIERALSYYDVERGGTGRLLSVPKAVLRQWVTNASSAAGSEDASCSKGSLLHFAARHGNAPALKVLFERGVVDAVDAGEYPALVMAARNGHAAAVALLLKHGAAIDASNKQGTTALILAAWQGHTAVVSLLLKNKASPKLEDANGWTALNLAAHGGRAAEVALLLEKGASVDARCTNGKTALLEAVEEGHEAAALLLLERGASMNVSIDGLTPLLMAAYNGYEAIAAQLLKRGAP
eukprot:2258976-Prymnesium_polylepis.2